MKFKKIILIFLGFVINSAFADVIVPEGNQQIRWLRFLGSIGGNYIDRCSRYGKQIFWMDYDPATNLYPTEVRTEVTKYMR